MKKAVVFALVVMLGGTYATADVTQYATGASGQTYHYVGGGTVGMEFEMNEDLVLSKLGVWDNGNNGFANAHDVALFAMDGTVLASATIGAGKVNPLSGGYRWADASPVSLVSGAHYVLAAYYRDGRDYFRTNAAIDPAFTLVTDLYDDGASLAMPTDTYFGDGVRGWYGPNLQAVAVPVPGAVLLGALGLGTAGLRFRRRHV